MPTSLPCVWLPLFTSPSGFREGRRGRSSLKSGRRQTTGVRPSMQRGGRRTSRELLFSDFRDPVLGIDEETFRVVVLTDFLAVGARDCHVSKAGSDRHELGIEVASDF